MTDPRMPNLFIAGAMKAGTTSMYHWLGQHPEIHMADPKEPNHFCTDLHHHEGARTWDQEAYLSLFEGAEDLRYRGEASVWYLFSEDACRRIEEETEEPRIIIMLRNPVDMVYSMHSQLVFMGNEPIEGFEAAWRAQDERREGKRLPDKPNPLEGVFYADYGKYSRYIQRYLETYPEDRLKIILFDDFVEDQLGTFQDVLRFLDLDPSFEPELDRRNPNTAVRSPWLRDFVRDLPGAIKAVTTRLPEGVRSFLQDLVEDANTRVEDRPPMPPALREEIKDAFREDVHRLGELLDRDLDDWVAPSPTDDPGEMATSANRAT